MLGFIVLRNEKQSRVEFVLDDGTGLLPCTLWDDSMQPLPSNVIRSIDYNLDRDTTTNSTPLTTSTTTTTTTNAMNIDDQQSKSISTTMNSMKNQQNKATSNATNAAVGTATIKIPSLLTLTTNAQPITSLSTTTTTTATTNYNNDNKISSPAALLTVGKLVRMQGKLKFYRDKHTVTVYRMLIEQDPDVESLHWLQTTQNAINVYRLDIDNRRKNDIVNQYHEIKNFF